ncbi:ACP S-malonyltransferase [Candidatus Haliotispira prima]|uniref:Malonyl CoA-acyl carrier protein transacylase n=1 Tax=Candidatus Haliotispira prima TaxID=3034016 RepID=A0ABY8MFB9_9SPIO|nr:ACP S-malonyltransferase [Candidatus Haliotispira prima]
MGDILMGDVLAGDVLTGNIFLFPGQGTQYPGMGKDLYENFAGVRELFRCAGEIASLDLQEILFNGTEEQLKQTNITQIGITLVNLSIATVLREKGVEAEAAAGFSLGEYSALWYAGVLSAEAVFQAVVERGRVMDECCRQLNAQSTRPAGMAAVLGLHYDEVAAALKPMQDAGQQIYIANYNAAKQIVIAGSGEAIAAAEAEMDSAGAMKYVVLKVGGPFHTPMLKSAAEAFAPFLQSKLEFAQPRLALYSNVTGKRVGPETDLAGLALQHIYSPVLWVSIEESLKADGFGRALEIGPGNVLTGLWRQFLRKEPCLPLGTLEQIEGLLQNKTG